MASGDKAGKPARKAWAEMTQVERDADTALRKARATELIASGGGKRFPKFIKAESLAAALTGHLLTPTGGTEKGSVSYGLPPGVTIALGGKQIRINKVSCSVLGEAQQADMTIGEDDFVL